MKLTQEQLEKMLVGFFILVAAVYGGLSLFRMGGTISKIVGVCIILVGAFLTRRLIRN